MEDMWVNVTFFLIFKYDLKKGNCFLKAEIIIIYCVVYLQYT